MRMLLHSFLAFFLALSIASSSSAAPYRFEMTGDYVATFLIDSNPVVQVLDPDAFLVPGVTGTFEGTAGQRDISFYTPVLYGGMAIARLDPFVSEMSVFGEQAFSGPIDAPTFLPGTYDFSGYVGTDGGKSVRLVISSVPEPSTLLIMLAGITTVATLTRARNRAAA